MPMQCYVHVKIKSISRKKSRFFHWEISISCTTWEYYNGYSTLLSNFLSIRLQEVKNKRKLQTFNSKIGRRRLREVVAWKRFPM